MSESKKQIGENLDEIKRLLSIEDSNAPKTVIESMNDKDIKEKILITFKSKNYDFDKIKKAYNSFKNKFGIDVLKDLNGKELLLRLFSPKNEETREGGLMYSLEFKDEYSLFGGIGGGSSYKYPLFLSKEKKVWIKGGSSKNQNALTEQEAINIAEIVRDNLVFICDIINRLMPFDSVDKYIELENTINGSDPMFKRLWVMKYLHLIYPGIFSTFYNSGWINKEMQNLNIQPRGGNYVQNGQLSLYAEELKIPNVLFALVLHEIFPELNNDEQIIQEVDEDLDENGFLPFRKPRTSTYSLNRIIYGAPGTGKTYHLPNIAIELIEQKKVDPSLTRQAINKKYLDYVNKGQIVFTTFHQNYSYEDFVQGLRPDNNSSSINFISKDGVFKKIADKALYDNEKNYVLIIDEINRANISKVLGELITLIEEDKRWGEENQLSVTLPSGDIFVVPNNLYIVGTMNSADKSISLIDIALRRRFNFIEQTVDSKLVADNDLQKILISLNKKLEEDLNTTDLLIGHAYFMKKTLADFEGIMNENVIPLLYEYYFDDNKKVKNLVQNIITDYGYVISNKPGRIKVEKKV